MGDFNKKQKGAFKGKKKQSEYQQSKNGGGSPAPMSPADMIGLHPHPKHRR